MTMTASNRLPSPPLNMTMPACRVCSCHVNIPLLLVLSGVILVLQASLLLRMLPPSPILMISTDDPNANDDDVGHHHQYNKEEEEVELLPWRNRPIRMTRPATTEEEEQHNQHLPTRHHHDGQEKSSMMHHSYPRWGDSRAIDFDDFAHYLENDLLSQTQHFPNTLYLIQNNSTPRLWVSQSLRKQHFGYFANDRIQPVESLLYEAVQYLQRGVPPSEDGRWKALREAIEVTHDAAGIPFVINYRDFTGCGGQGRQGLNDNNNNNTTTLSKLPIFTMCATVSPDCDYAFPIPTYFVVQTAKQNWTSLMKEQHELQPFHLKHKKAIWRGAFTGRSWNHGLDNQRSSMYHLSQNHTDILDVQQATKGPPYNEHFLPMEQFRNYRAVLDLDGDAWSKRFVQLLCYNSVVVKVEPQYVDYFHPELRPFTHYIPVRADLSDLVEKVSYAVSDEHQDDILRIIENAQQWCSEHVVQQTLIEDMLDIISTYVEYLNRGDSNWQQRWIEIRGKLDSQGLDMVPLRAVGTTRLSKEAGAVEWTKLKWKQA